MNKSPMIKFENDIAKIREEYKQFQGMAGRTIRALWRALGGGYAKILEYQSNALLQAEFELTLAAKKMRTSPKKILLVTEYMYFPHVLHPAEGHKPDTNKARTYAKVYERALASNISAADFVSFVRKNRGIQNIATDGTMQPKRQMKGSPVGKSAPRKSTAPTSSPAVVVEQSGRRWPVFFDAVRFNNTKVAETAAHALQATDSEPQRLTVTYYTSPEKRIMTSITTEPWKGPVPFAMAPIIGSSIVEVQQASAGGKVGPKSTRRPTPVVTGTPRPVPSSMTAPGRPPSKQLILPRKAAWRP